MIILNWRICSSFPRSTKRLSKMGSYMWTVAFLALVCVQYCGGFSCLNGYDEAPLDFDDNDFYSFTSSTSTGINDMLDGSGEVFIDDGAADVKVTVKGAVSGAVFDTSKLEMRTACVEKVKLRLTIPNQADQIIQETISDHCDEFTTTKFEDLGPLTKIRVTFKFKDNGCDCDNVQVKKLKMEACTPE